MTAHHYYGTYGAQLTGSSPLAANPFIYTAREDDRTGLYFYRARYYNPSMVNGMWVVIHLPP